MSSSVNFVSSLGTGDVTTVEILNGTIINEDVKSDAAIALSKMAALTASEIAISDASGFVVSAAVATYPSLAELIHVKGVTSAIQTQMNTKMPIDPRVSAEASSATPTIDTDAVEHHSITALGLAITSMTTNLSGTPVNFQKLIIRFLDDGTNRAITWGADFQAMGVALPTTTTASKVLTVGFIYDSVDSKWGAVASVEEA